MVEFAVELLLEVAVGEGLEGSLEVELGFVPGVVEVDGVEVGLAVSAEWCLIKCPFPAGFSVPFSVVVLPYPPLPLSSGAGVDVLLVEVELSYLTGSLAFLNLSFSAWGNVISLIKVNVPKFIIS